MSNNVPDITHKWALKMNESSMYNICRNNPDKIILSHFAVL